MTSPRFIVELEPLSGAWSRVPPEVRLRRLLRGALRAYGLRARLVRPSGATSALAEESIADPGRSCEAVSEEVTDDAR